MTFLGSILFDVGEKSPASFFRQNNRKDTLISFRIKSSKTIQKGGNQDVLYKSYQRNLRYSRLKHHF
jgi:hypothetical protein